MKAITRRYFIKITNASLIVMSVAFGACRRLVFNTNSNPDNNITPDERAVLKEVHKILFPHEHDSPGAEDCYTVIYLENLLNRNEITGEDLMFFKQGIVWINQTAYELFNDTFLSINVNKKQLVLEDLAKYSRGEKWLSRNISYIFEAMLSDPLYGSNINEKSWKWLEHTPGIPRPLPTKLYYSYDL